MDIMRAEAQVPSIGKKMNRYDSQDTNKKGSLSSNQQLKKAGTVAFRTKTTQ